MDKSYNPKQYEQKIYEEWEQSGFFNPDNLPDKDKKKPFSIAIPPPNATGILHLGHATMLAIQDAVIRFKRMKGFKTLWLPGTDHASIATQTKVEKIIKEEGLTRHDLGREKFLERVEKFVEKSRGTIRSQIRQMGSSCDWSRERYTLDEGLSKAVQEIFIRMYNDGLIYRGNRIVNWCPRCESTLADDEVEYKEEQGKLYYIKYPLADNESRFLIVATTRPETMFGDSAIAVNPEDPRYKDFIEKNVKLPLTDRKILVIADERVDLKFGTGALKITPAHDKDDFEIGKLHGLDVINIINNNGTLNELAGDYKGLLASDARKKVIADLEKQDLIEKIEDYIHSVGKCYKCDAVIEPLVSLQWFIDVDKKIQGREKSLKELAIESVKSEKINTATAKRNGIKILPERFEKTYFNWMENLHDWCVSRQIWFGHRIPAYYCKCGQVVVSLTPPENCWKCNKNNFKQDPDTLDTWFSSGLWTFSTLGWPEETEDLKNYHPTSLMETGYDILFFWIARMIIMSQYALGDIPFETVYLHGMVLDKFGKKMSKSKNTGIDPVEMIEKFGADALRLSMLIGTSPGNDFRLYEEKIAGYRNFVNKLWNIARFIINNCHSEDAWNCPPKFKNDLSLSDQWILLELNSTIKSATENIEKYHLSQAGEILYDFTWNKLADWYLEISKIERENKPFILNYILQTILKLWHPFTPFVTEAIWQEINPNNLLMIEKWPKEAFIKDIIAEIPKSAETIEEINKIKKQFNTVQKIITSIRNVRAEYKIDPTKNIDIVIETTETGFIVGLEHQAKIIEKLTKTTIVRMPVLEEAGRFKNKDLISVIVNSKTQIKIILDIIDLEKEKNRLIKEIELLKTYKEKLEKELSVKNFIINAPEKIVKQKEKQLEQTKEKIKQISHNIEHIT